MYGDIPAGLPRFPLFEFFHQIHDHVRKPLGGASGTGALDLYSHLIGGSLQFRVQVPDDLHVIGDKTDGAHHYGAYPVFLMKCGGVVNDVRF